jgi:hypothetical protein
MEKLAFSRIMPEFERDPERVWDEYDWERFLKQQDQKTEKYMELLEKYLDDPQRDEIIAREMGWSQVTDSKDWSEEVDALMKEDWRSSDEDESLDEEQKNWVTSTFEDHNLYRSAFALTVWIDKLFDQDASLQNEPAAVKLATHAALASAKLAAALSDDDVDEIGMTIAYLKRALKAITVSMEAAAKLLSDKLIVAAQYSTLQQRLFQVRDGIILLMGEYRGEWRRRFGSGGFRS